MCLHMLEHFIRDKVVVLPQKTLHCCTDNFYGDFLRLFCFDRFLLCGKEQREDSSKSLILQSMETITGFVNVNGKMMNHSFKGHTTVTDHYLEFHALILIMISMCVLKVKKNTYKKALQSKIIQSSRHSLRKIYRTGTTRLRTEGTRYYRDTETTAHFVLSFINFHSQSIPQMQEIAIQFTHSAYLKHYKSKKPQFTRVKLADMQCFLSVLGSKHDTLMTK